MRFNAYQCVFLEEQLELASRPNLAGLPDRLVALKPQADQCLVSGFDRCFFLDSAKEKKTLSRLGVLISAERLKNIESEVQRRSAFYKMP
jgi:hypothetical protein